MEDPYPGGERKRCMAACEDQTFSVTVSSNKFPGEESYNHRSDFCIIVRLGWKTYSYLLIAHLPFRKLSVLTCPEKSMRTTLEKRYPGLCDDVESVMEAEGNG